MKKIVFGAAAAAFVVIGASSGAMAQTCEIKDNQYANGWTCASEVVSSQSIQVWVRSGDSDNCRWGTVDEVVTQDVAVNPGGQPVDSKSGEETSSYDNAGWPAAAERVSCAGLGDVLIVTKNP